MILFTLPGTSPARRARITLFAGLVALGTGCDSAKGDAPTPAPAASTGATGVAPSQATADTPHADKPDADKPATVEPMAPVDKPVAAKHPAEPPKRDKPTPEQTAKLKANSLAFRAARADGRRAVQKGQYEQGLEFFAKARKLRPNNPSVLGESGFAAHKLGDSDAARRWTRAALEHADEPKRVAMLEYNMGQIEVSAGNKGAAAEHYKRSLALRENATVRSKLQALGSVPPPKAVAELEAFCAQIKQELPCAEYDTPEEDPDLEEDAWLAGLETDCSCEVSSQLVNPDPTSKLLGAAIISAGESSEVYIERASILVVKTATGGWQRVASVSDSWIKEFADSDSDWGSISALRFEPVVAGGGSELRAVLNTHHEDMPDLDEEDPAYKVDTRIKREVLCDGEALACVAWGSSVTTERGRFWQWEVLDVKTTVSSLAQKFSDTGLTLSAAKGKPNKNHLAPMVGTHTWTEIFSNPAFSPVPLR